MFASQALFLLYLASVAAAQDDGTYYDGGTNTGRVVAGVIACEQRTFRYNISD